MIVSSFRFRRKHRRSGDAPYASLAGWNTSYPSTGGYGFAPMDLKPRLPRPPRPDRGPRPPRTRRQRIRHLLLALFVILVGLPALLATLFYWGAEIPEPHEMRTNQVATVTASDGTTVLARFVPPDGNRIPIPLSEVPVPVRDAVLSAEDRDFYRNPGYSTSGMVRAVRDNLLGRAGAGGGSTITQQYVKNAFLGPERTVARKLRELVISAKMAQQWTKDEVLAAYLNTIYFGRGAYGIAAAATAYFGKPVSQLTVAEGAVLAALIRSPSTLDPQNHLLGLQQRWNYVLDGMVEMGTLKPEDRKAMVFPPIVPVPAPPDANIHGPEGLIRAQVLRELLEAGISEQTLNTGALQITTTIDPRAQQAAVDAVRGRLEGQPPELRAAVVAIDPQSGAVRAYYGGADGLGFDFAQAPVQTGSAFKTFAVIAALQQGIPLSRPFDSAPVEVNGTLVRNVEDESCGVCPLSEAFKRSLNTSFYRLTLEMANGPQAIADAAHQAGIPKEIPGVEGRTLSENGGQPVPAIVLGTYLVRPIDMASAYATIAAQGIYHQPYFVQRVVAGDGTVLLDRDPAKPVGEPLPRGEQRIPPDIADRTAQAMLPIPAYSNGHALADRPASAKTGTTQLGDTGQNKDAWMVGFTRTLSTAVWIGTENSQPLLTAGGARIYGSGLPADIWKQTMDGALVGTPLEPPAPAPPPAPAAPPPQAGAVGNPYDILNPPQAPQPPSQEPFIVIPPASEQAGQQPVPTIEPEPEQEPGPGHPPPGVPAPAPPPPRLVEIFPGLSIPMP
ncbi:transglycosylase domain-containing protein [Nocardia paucivorans]|uniref:transglycosylase domain-containing protein n=1 Tax=Nocardia paucivorans TaxID=114259 RepID=UPI0002E94EE7|nr:transglycosylase domain-containing protein [Nocardia paucivorans]